MFDSRVGHHLKAAGNSVGINFTGKCPVTPNTLPAHALLDYSKEVDGGSKQNDLMEAIFNVSVVSRTVDGHFV